LTPKKPACSGFFIFYCLASAFIYNFVKNNKNHMKKVLFYLTLSLLFSSCIEIKEVLKVNSDGSGSLTMTVDMSKVGSSFGQANQQADMAFVKEIQDAPGRADSVLKNCPGISNLKTSSEKGLYVVGFNFKNSKALNTALYKLFKQKKSLFKPNFIKVTKHKTKQMNFAPLIKKYLLKSSSSMFSDMLFQLIRIESSFELPAKAKKISNIKAFQENDGLTIKMKYTLYELMNNDFDYGISMNY